jgi:hypothetical protein
MLIYCQCYPLHKTSPLRSRCILPHVVPMVHTLGMGEFSLGIKIQILVFFECVCQVRFLTFICLRATLLSYDVAHRTVRSWRQNSFGCFSRWPWNTLRNRMCVAGRSGGKLSAVFLQPIQDRGLYRTEEWLYKEPCFPIQASMTLKSKVMLNTLNI